MFTTETRTARRSAFSRVASLALGALLFSATIAIAASVAHDLTGKWDFAVVTENGTGTPTVTFKQEGEKLSGTYSSRMLGERTLTGSVKGDSLKFTLSNTASPDAVTMTFAGVILDKDRVKGRVDFGGQGGAEFTGARQVAPK
jgi:hypothetical protein